MWAKLSSRFLHLLSIYLFLIKLSGISLASHLAPRSMTSPLSSNFQALFLVLRQILFQPIHQGCELLYLHGQSSFDLLSFYNFDIFQLNHYSSGQRLLTIYATNVTYPRHEDIHRHTPSHCSIALLFFANFSSPETLQPWLFSNIIPRYGPVIRKDEDRFIFISPSESAANVALLSPKFGEKIKYKIALYQNDEVTCSTIDFYAGPNGTPLPRILHTFNSDVDNISEINLFLDMTRDFNGHLFRITVPNVKYRFEMEWRDGAYHPKRGFYKWWLDEAINKFNFTYFMFWSSFEKATGKPLENGTWVGAAGDLLYDRADIAVIVGETYSRQPFFGFSAVLSYEWFFFMTHQPWNTYSPNAIFWPFTPLMWSLFFLSLLVMTYSLKKISEWSADPRTHNNKKWTYATMFRYIYTTFLEQDREGPVHTHSIRMLCAFWLMFALVTSTAYRGKLVTLIAFPVDSWIPSTFEELAYSSFKVALNNVGKVGTAYDMLSSSTNPVFKQLFNKMEMIAQPEVCLFRAMKEDMGCIIWEGIMQYANARNVSDRFGYVPMVQSKEIALFIGDGFTYERRAIFKHHMDHTIEAALQMGLTIKWLDLDKEFIWKQRSKWEKENNKTEVYYNRYDGPQKLILSQFTGLFLMSLGGLVIAAVQFAMEHWKWKRDNGGKAKVSKEMENNKEQEYKLNVPIVMVMPVVEYEVKEIVVQNEVNVISDEK